MDKIDLTPVGVQKDPERVNRAVDAFTKAQAAACNALIHALRDMESEGLLRGRVKVVLADAIKAARGAEDAQEEFLRAISGHPARGVRS